MFITAFLPDKNGFLPRARKAAKAVYFEFTSVHYTTHATKADSNTKEKNFVMKQQIGLSMKKFKQDRALWYRGMKQIMKIRYKKPKFVFLGEMPSKSSIILSNHEGTDAPMALEIYCQFPIRMWGTHEMNSGLKKMYRYQTQVYYHEKKHWNIHLARAFCLLASPLTNLFYQGLKLISTYRDGNFLQTVRQSYDAIKNGENVVIFPEKSPDGYLEELQDFYAGFVIFAQYCLKKGIDTPIYVSYYKKKERVYVFDKPIMFSELKAKFETKEEMASYLLDKCNALNKIDLSEQDKEQPCA